MIFSIVIATHKRLDQLRNLFFFLEKQTYKEFEVIVAHSGAEDGTKEFIENYNVLTFTVHYLKCLKKGAANQRNEGVEKAKGQWVVFLDDDVEPQMFFLAAFLETIRKFPDAGGVSGLIENQNFSEPGKATRMMLQLLGVNPNGQIDGKVVGPVLNFLPKKDGPEYQKLGWMPSCVCAYKKDIFISLGGFSDYFKDYSFAEDVYLSSLVASKHPLYLTRSAVLYHYDTGSRNQPDMTELGKMQIKNRFYIANKVFKDSSRNMLNRILVWQIFNAILLLGRRQYSFFKFVNHLKGLLVAYKSLI